MREAALLAAAVLLTLAAGPVAGAEARAHDGTASAPSSSSAPADFIKLISNAHGQPTRGVAWSPDASKVAVGDDSGKVTVYDSTSGVALKTFLAHDDAVQALSWSKDGALLASGSLDNKVKLWNTGGWKEEKKIEVFDDDILDLQWSPRPPPAAQELVVASDSGKIKRFNAKGEVLNNISTPAGGSARAISWEPKGDLLTGIVVDKGTLKPTVYYWAATSGDQKRSIGFDKIAFDVKWGPSGLIGVAFDNGNVSILEDVTLILKKNVSVPGGKALSLGWTVKGEGGAAPELFVGSDDGRVRLVEVASANGSVSATLPVGHTSSVLNMEFSPNATKLATVGQDGNAIIWGEPAPRVVWTSPPAGDRNVSVDVRISVKFDRPMDETSLKTATSLTGLTVSVTLTNDSAFTLAVVTPANKLENDKAYTLTIGTGAKSAALVGGMPLAKAFSLAFNTVPAKAPGLDIPITWILAGVGVLLLLIIIGVLASRRRRRGGASRGEVRVARRGKGDDWESSKDR